jgi:hypothetical protein
MPRLILRAPLSRALGLSRERYELDIDCSATLADVVKFLERAEDVELVSFLDQLIFIANGKLLNPYRRLEDQVSCSETIEITLLPALEGGELHATEHLQRLPVGVQHHRYIVG